jgi:hypothetical protein
MDLPDWQKETLRDAYRVEQGFGDRYISIPRADSSEGFDDMEDFAETIQNPSLRGRLARSLSMNHPFRRFKDVLANIPDLEEQWFKFHEGRQKERVLEWLADEGIELNSESS